MCRHSSIFSTVLALFVALPLTTSIAQEALPGTASLVDVLYLYYGNTIETYNVDRKTGVPEYRGQITVPVPVTFSDVNARPAPDDHFVYVFGFDLASDIYELMVYPTNPDGSLQETAIQVENFSHPFFSIDPDGRFAYTIAATQNSQGQTVSWQWLLSVLDPETGMVQPPVVVAQEPGNGPCSQWLEGGVWQVGFGPGGDQLYEEWECTSSNSGDSGTSLYYYTRQINPQTGALGAPVETITGYGEGQGGTEISFTPNAILGLNTYEDFSLSVFPLSGGTTPIFTCTTEMFEACSNATFYTVDPEGKDIFFQIPSGTILVSRLLLDRKRIVPTGYYISEPGSLSFSPDDALIYWSEGAPYISIYLFDPDRGSVTSSERLISGPQSGFGFIPAVRW
jgi:hypothetical protein